MLETALWILLWALALVGAAALYRFFTPLRLRRLPRTLRSIDGGPVEMEDSLACLAASVNLPLFRSARIDVLRNGVEIFPAMLRAIDAAEESIDFLTYVYWQGEIADRFAERLCAAARRGVPVRVLLDGYGSMKMKAELRRRMRAAGCRVAIFRPVRWGWLKRANFRTHRKVLVVDRRVGFTGGVGIAGEWEGDARDASEWRDTHFQVRGAAVRFLEAAFDENWREATGELILWRSTDDVERGDVQLAPILGRPSLGMSRVAFSHWFLARTAQRRLWIQTPYFVPTDALLDELVAAAERGLDVRVMIPDRHTDEWSTALASRRFLPRLLDAGVRVLAYQRTMLHSKVTLADDDLALVGSANLDHRSFELNYEMVLALRSRRVVEELEAHFLDDEAKSVPVDHGWLSGKPAWERAATWLIQLVRHQL